MIGHTKCGICDEYDTYRCNGDLHWCSNCGDTEHMIFLDDEDEQEQEQEPKGEEDEDKHSADNS